MINEAELSRLQTGYKQTVKALECGRAEKLYVAKDCEEKISDHLVLSATEKNIPVVFVPTMKELGTECRIEVKASCAVVLKA